MKIKISDTKNIDVMDRGKYVITSFTFQKEGDDKLYSGKTFDRLYDQIAAAQASGDYLETIKAEYSDQYNNYTIKFDKSVSGKGGSGGSRVNRGPISTPKQESQPVAQQPSQDSSKGGFKQISYEEYKLVSGRALVDAIGAVCEAFQANADLTMPSSDCVLEAAQKIQTSTLIAYADGKIARFPESELLSLAVSNPEAYAKMRDTVERLVVDKASPAKINEVLASIQKSNLLAAQKRKLVEACEEVLKVMGE